MKIEERQLEAQRVAYIRHYGAYGLEPTVQTLNRLRARAWRSMGQPALHSARGVLLRRLHHGAA